MLRESDRTMHLRIERASSGSRVLRTVGEWAVVDSKGQAAGSVAPACVEAFLGLLRALGPMPELASPLEPLPVQSGSHRTDESTVDEEPARWMSDEQSVRWDEVVRARILPAVQRVWTSGAPEQTKEPCASGQAIVLFHGDAEQLVRIGIHPADGLAGPGFLCGRVRLQVPEVVVGHGCLMQSVEAIARECMAISESDWPVDSPVDSTGFLRDAWDALGATLLPRAGAQGSLSRGMVGPRELRLEFLLGDCARFELVLLPADRAKNPVASRGSLALQYHVSHATAHHPQLARVVRFYAAKLAAWRG
jgi:hypothetical protein